MNTLLWSGKQEFTVDGVRFRCTVNDYAPKTDAERFIICKDRAVLENYAEVFAANPPKNVLEFGIFEGGSSALYALWFEVEKLVGVDICEPVKALEDFRQTHAIGRKISSYYRVSQTDRRRIEEIARDEFGSTPLDAVIDDASHVYGNTKRTFEIAFPLLRPGGTYVIEDWGWAHWPGSRFYPGKTALSMLIMELIMLCASRGDLVSEVRVFPAFAFVRKSICAPQFTDFHLDSL